MAKEVVYFNATKIAGAVTFHYNKKLDGAFVDSVSLHFKEIAKKMSINVNNPKEYDSIKVFIYPSLKLFNSVFGKEIEKRYYKGKHNLEDMYIVQDSEGNIHIVSPRGKGADRFEALMKILVMRVLSEYVSEKKKQDIKSIVTRVVEKKKEKEEQREEETPEEDKEQIEEDFEQEELTEEEFNDIIQVQETIEEIKEDVSKKEEKNDTRTWLEIGWLGYVSGRLKKQKDIEFFGQHIAKKGVSKISGLKDSKLFENYDYAKEYACATVEYIVETYGKEKFLELMENPKEIKKIFGIPKRKFDSDVKAYIYRRYSTKQKIEEIKKIGIKEVELAGTLELSNQEGLSKIKE